MRSALYGFFCRLYGVNKEEIKLPITEYRSFKEFFTRELKDNSRPFAEPGNDGILCAPADSRVLSFGEVVDDKIHCVKGHTYSVAEMLYGKPLASVSSADLFPSLKHNALYYAVMYLAPSDYHRYFSPTSVLLKERCHVLGYLNPVMPRYLLTHQVLLRAN